MNSLIIVFVMLFGSLSNLFGQTSFNPHVDIKYVGVGIRAIIAIDYSSFDSAFTSTQYRTKVIDSKDEIFKKIQKYYSTVRYSSHKMMIDTRYKFMFYFKKDSTPITIYGSYFNDFIYDGRVMMSCDFKRLMMKVLKSLKDTSDK